MADLTAIWSEVLPGIKDGVTGVGVWSALNAVQPLALDEGVFVMGLPHGESELAGHLRLALTRRLIEQAMAEKLKAPVTLRVIDGTGSADYEAVKRRDAESRRLQNASLEKMRAEMSARSNWDSVYETLSRRFAAVATKSLPQNRARFLEEAVEIVAEARRNQGDYDEPGERSFARCIERVAQYADVPSVLVAREILKRSGEL